MEDHLPHRLSPGLFLVFGNQLVATCETACPVIQHFPLSKFYYGQHIRKAKVEKRLSEEGMQRMVLPLGETIWGLSSLGRKGAHPVS